MKYLTSKSALIVVIIAGFTVGRMLLSGSFSSSTELVGGVVGATAVATLLVLGGKAFLNGFQSAEKDEQPPD